MTRPPLRQATKADTTASSVPLPPIRKSRKRAPLKKKNGGGMSWGKAFGILGGVGATVAAGNYALKKMGLAPEEGMLHTASQWLQKK
jgi:hypothetical protein